MEKISLLHRVKSSIPTYIKEEKPKFTDFILDYYKYLETNGVVGDLTKFQKNMYGLEHDPEYTKAFLSGLGFDIGVNLSLNPDLQYKIINDFFAMRGSEPSLKLMFRLLFNEDVTIEYPRDKLLYLSMGNYKQNKYLITTTPSNDSTIPDITFSGVVGLTSQATGTVENIDVIVTNTGRYFLIECSMTSDEFLKNEVIKILTKDGEISVVNTGVVDINVDITGNGYKKFDTVTISGCDQTGTGYVSALTSGGIESMSIVNGGTNYAVGDKIYAFNGFTAKVTQVNSTTKAIEGVMILNQGYKYNEYPSLNIRSELGQGAIFNLYGSKVGGVKTITFDNPYSLCSQLSVITITSEKGYGFTGTLEIVGQIDHNKYQDKKGMLGVNCNLIDSDVYQEYSYKILSNVPTEKYIDLIDEFTHPYGFVRVPTMLTSANADLLQDDLLITNVILTEYRDTVTDILIDNLPDDIDINEEVTLNVELVVSEIGVEL